MCLVKWIVTSQILVVLFFFWYVGDSGLNKGVFSNADELETLLTAPTCRSVLGYGSGQIFCINSCVVRGPVSYI